MNDILIGVDAGGTQTTAAAYSAEGELLAQTTGAAGNVAADPAHACQNIIETIQALLPRLGEMTAQPLPLLCVGADGISRGGQALSQALSTAFAGQFSRIQTISDAELALYAAHGEGDGLLLIAGTGSIGYRKAGQTLLRCGGWGHLIGDEGSAYAVAMAAVRAITQATDRGLPPPTALWNALQRCLGIQTPSELIAFVYSRPKADIAALGRTVSDCAHAGDPTSTALLQQAGADLAVLVRLLVERAPTTDALPLCCSGSLLTKNAIVRAAFETALHAAALPISSVFDLQEPTRGVLSLYKTTT